MTLAHTLVGITTAATLALTACGSSEQPEAETVTSYVPAPSTSAYSPAPVPPPAPPAPASPPAPAATAQTWTMPNLIGQNLQAAQDSLQALTDFAVAFSTSTDLTGEGRAQVMDRNWQVCSSTPAPGATLTADTMVDFGVVRDSETCP